MTMRQGLEIAALTVLCVVSLGTFWRGPRFNAAKKLGLVLAFVVFIAVSLIILR